MRNAFDWEHSWAATIAVGSNHTQLTRGGTAHRTTAPGRRPVRIGDLPSSPWNRDRLTRIRPDPMFVQLSVQRRHPVRDITVELFDQPGYFVPRPFERPELIGGGSGAGRLDLATAPTGPTDPPQFLAQLTHLGTEGLHFLLQRIRHVVPVTEELVDVIELAREPPSAANTSRPRSVIT